MKEILRIGMVGEQKNLSNMKPPASKKMLLKQNLQLQSGLESASGEDNQTVQESTQTVSGFNFDNKLGQLVD